LSSYLGLAINYAVFTLPIREALLYRQLHTNFAYGAITL